MSVTKPAVLIDLDNTILDFDWAEKRALTAAFREVGSFWLDIMPLTACNGNSWRTAC